MLHVTESARRELDAYFADKEKSPIRVYLASGGCSGPRLALALDESNDADTVFDENGLTFSVNNTLLAQTGDITVDLTDFGFAVDSANPVNTGGGCGGGCGGCAGSCS